MSCRNHRLDKIDQVVASKDLSRVVDGNATITQIHAMKKGMFGKTFKGVKVKHFKNSVWRQA